MRRSISKRVIILASNERFYCHFEIKTPKGIAVVYIHARRRLMNIYIHILSARKLDYLTKLDRDFNRNISGAN